MSDLTLILQAVGRGEGRSLDELLPLVYEELRRLAAARMAQESAGHTLQPTALVHEAFLRLVEGKLVHPDDRTEFCAVIARMMRFVLVDHARKRSTHKRFEDRVRGELTEEIPDRLSMDFLDLLSLDEALDRLMNLNPRHAQVVELRYFGGLNIEETAATLGVSTWVVKDDWRMARAWLRVQLQIENRS